MALNRNRLKGTGVALVTPFNKKGSVDFPALTKLINHLIKGKVDYFVVLGTTGESVTLSKSEKEAVVNHVITVTNKRLPIVMGLGGNNTQDILDTIKSTKFQGIDAILSVSPYYNKPNQNGIYQHYKMIAAASSLPIILYNVPGRTGANVSAETTLQLAADCKNIIGIKDASSNIEQQHMKIIKNKPKDFLVISGDDNLTLPILACGGDGVISVVANAYPKDFSDMVRVALQGNFEKARKLHYKLTDITELLFADGSPGGIKAVLKSMNICDDIVRLPLMNIGQATQEKLIQLVKRYKWKKAKSQSTILNLL